MKQDSEPGLAYFAPTTLNSMADQGNFPLTWEEMIQHSELGYEELKILLKLGEKCDLSIEEIILLYLRYWENLDGQEIADRCGVDRRVVSKHLILARGKLHPKLITTISSNRG